MSITLKALSILTDFEYFLHLIFIIYPHAIIIIYCVCPIFANPVDWLKTLSNGVKTHLFKLKTSKISTPRPARY